jgi:hypothetical protein
VTGFTARSASADTTASAAPSRSTTARRSSTPASSTSRSWASCPATTTDDGLAGDEGQFLACSFWLVSALALNGRPEEARTLFERLLELRNDLGLLAEEYDVGRGRQVGNFPQAFSHLALIVAARDIAAAEATTSVLTA